ncbi:aldehyde dehydrogenase [Nocardioides humi]|uniref:Aldehyde dehydrogenase n=1 Tax=Nocardioides humi TaxID=449461 RepID=A0ABN2ABB3_9ACTN|nr:aldehyde dehydrogenase [Nocardioides humi]
MDYDFDSWFVDGEWVRSADADPTAGPVRVRAASTREPVGSFPRLGVADVARAVGAARAAFDDPGGWSAWTPAARAEAMEDLADRLAAKSEEIGRLVSLENGMPISLSQRSEAHAGAGLLRFFAAMVRERSEEEVRVGVTGRHNVVRSEPLGVVAAVVPWNYPQALAFTKVAPLLAAGCTVVLKPAEETSLDSYLIAQAVAESGLPRGVVNVLPGGRDVGAALVEHPGVDKVAFTGSTAAGRAIAVRCAELLRPVSLELGGKSAAIVLEDVDLTSRVAEFREATMRNNGQTCHLSTRVLVPAARYDHYVDQVTDLIGSQVVGDALDAATDVGPLVSEVQRDRVEGYLGKARGDGATATTGGGRPTAGQGWYVEPTVLRDVDNDQVIAREEVFGPVLCVIPYGDTDDAVRLANDSDYGLGGTVWSEDEERAGAVARRIRTGTVGINGYRSDPVAPFGGIKGSGTGRELGIEGLQSYRNIKSIFPAP